MDWLANGGLPWASYREFMSFHLIVIDKKPSVRLVDVGETWQHLFSKTVLKVTVPEATITCQDKHLCAGLKAVIDGAVHGVQYIWDKNLTT